ncbi:MAG: hypothetical protein PHH11_13450 [Methylomonas sp.]|nr:hypothetical protein [Methylomonas sp.]
MARQFERLSDDFRSVLRAASVVGMNLSAEAVAAALAVDSVEVEACCENLAHLRHFIQAAAGEPGRYGFRHALYQKYAYDHLPPLQQAGLHLCVGEWLESTRTRPEEAVVKAPSPEGEGVDVPNFEVRKILATPFADDWPSGVDE